MPDYALSARGLVLIKNVAETEYSGVDAGNGQTVRALAGETILVTGEMADYLLTSFAADWELATFNMGNLSDLETSAQTALVAAINEVNTNADAANTAIGTIGSLETTATDLVAAINEVRDLAVAAEESSTIGTLGSLTTTAQNTLVAAINEVDAHADTANTAIGTLASLDTTAKSNLVAAVNEVRGVAVAALPLAGGTLTGDVTIAQSKALIAAGTGALIGKLATEKWAFFGGTPRVQYTHVVDAKTDYTTGDLDAEAEVIVALNATNTKINAILAVFEAFGLVATA